MTTDENQNCPTGWAKASLNELLDFVIGGDWGQAPEHTDPNYVPVLCIRASEVRNWKAEKGSTAALRCVKRSSLETRRLKEGDIVIEISGGGPDQPVGRTLLIDKECLAKKPDIPKICTNFFRLMRPSVHIESSFLQLFLEHFYATRDMSRYQGGSNNLRNLKFDDYLSIEIPLAPSHEQRRIVAKIEELFSELDKGIEALTTAREQLKAYRIAILHKGVCDEQGKLYPVRPLDDLIGPIEQGWSPTCDLNRPADDGEWAIIKTTVVQPMSYLPKECKPFPSGLTPRPDIEIQDGDILMTRKGPRIRTGVVCYVTKARPRSMLCDTVYRFRAKEDLIDPEYLELALNSPHVVREIDSKKAGISESGISLNHSRVRAVRIPVVASKEQQRRIVAALKENLEYVERTDAVIENEILRVGALRQSILKQAFSGQLVAQDLNDEPASVLLERIRAEHDSATTKTQHKTKRAKNGKTKRDNTA